MADGLRERKKRRTRAALIRAAVELCELKGVEAVTVADIAEAAEVSRRTFFNYFASREEAILGGGSERAARLAKHLAARPADEPVWLSLRSAVATFLAEAGEPEREWMARARLVRANPSLVAQQRADFAEMEHRLAVEVAARTGAGADDLEPRLVVAVAVAAIRVAVDHWIDTPADVPLSAAVDEALAHTKVAPARATEPM